VDELCSDDALDRDALVQRRDALQAGVADLEQLRAQVEALEETVRLYADQLQRLGELEEVALRHELAALQEPPSPARCAAMPSAQELMREARLLDRKGRQYDRLMEEVKELRPKARRLDRLAEEVEELRGKAGQPSPQAAQVDREPADLQVLRYKARRHDELVAEVRELRAKAARYDALVIESKKLLPNTASDPLFVVRAYEPLLSELKQLRFKVRQLEERGERS
jgi:hypothetical protein